MRFNFVSEALVAIFVIVSTVCSHADSIPVWRQLPNTPGGGTIRHDDIQFLDPLNGWASQNPYIFHTTNGGLTWTTNFTKTGAHFRSVTFMNSNVGFAGNLGPG